MSQDFWNSRAEKFGHTGWSDRSIYLFDQAARLKCIHEVVEQLNIKTNAALDFGAGTGDFSRMLANKFNEVTAFEVAETVQTIAKKCSTTHTNIKYERGDSVLKLNLADNSLDLILSVTVLGHLMDEKSLDEHLSYFHEKLNDNGVVVAMEYSPQNEMESNEYQRFLSFEKWKSAFEKQSFGLMKDFGFYSPTESPCSSFKAYQNKLPIKLFNLTSGLIGSERKLKTIAEEIVEKSDDYFWAGKDDDLIKVMIFIKK